MIKLYYYDQYGQKKSASAAELVALAHSGVVTPDTIIEDERGKQIPAKRMKGLDFSALPSPKKEEEEKREEKRRPTNRADVAKAPDFSALQSAVAPATTPPSPSQIQIQTATSFPDVKTTPSAPQSAAPVVQQASCGACGTPLAAGQKFCPGCGANVAPAGTGDCPDQLTAVLLALFFGALGVHKFYLKETGMGILYLLLSLTVVFSVISGIMAIIDAILMLSMSKQKFIQKYSR